MTSGLSLELPEVATMQISGRSHFQAEKIALKGDTYSIFQKARWSEQLRTVQEEESEEDRLGGGPAPAAEASAGWSAALHNTLQRLWKTLNREMT